jgi:hypothetical protein
MTSYHHNEEKQLNKKSEKLSCHMSNDIHARENNQSFGRSLMIASRDFPFSAHPKSGFPMIVGHWHDGEKNEGNSRARNTNKSFISHPQS